MAVKPPTILQPAPLGEGNHLARKSKRPSLADLQHAVNDAQHALQAAKINQRPTPKRAGPKASAPKNQGAVK